MQKQTISRTNLERRRVVPIRSYRLFFRDNILLLHDEKRDLPAQVCKEQVIFHLQSHFHCLRVYLLPSLVCTSRIGST